MIRNILSVGQSMNYLLDTVLSDSYKLITVDDVFHGMHFLKEANAIDLIIVDIDYQTKQTIDFILHIHTSKLYKQRVFALLSTDNLKSHETVLKSCVHEYFVKPFNPMTLVKAINKSNLPILSASLS